jgi:flavin reductase (DIM6/NTAB) family NADH-FMN oxidoreductase RutF
MIDASTESDSSLYRDAMSLLATGVTVVTTTNEQGIFGMTASAVCSLSLEPVEVLVCVKRSLPTHTALTQSGAFCVNVLGEHQGELARRFATPGVDRFRGVAIEEGFHVPVLSEAIAYFVCELRECFPGGDHSIFIGRVGTCGHKRGSRPLLYFDRAFGSLESPETSMLRSWIEGGAAA